MKDTEVGTWREKDRRKAGMQKGPERLCVRSEESGNLAWDQKEGKLAEDCPWKVGSFSTPILTFIDEIKPNQMNSAVC